MSSFAGRGRQLGQKLASMVDHEEHGYLGRGRRLVEHPRDPIDLGGDLMQLADGLGQLLVQMMQLDQVGARRRAPEPWFPRGFPLATDAACKQSD